MYLFALLPHLLPLLARAGGGGSGGGGGGGGIVVIGLVGYIPMHFICAQFRKRGYNHEAWLIWQVAGWILGCLYSVALIIATGTLGLLWVGLIMAVGAVLGTGAGLYNWFSKIKRSKKVTAALKAAAAKDKAWDESELLAGSKQIFMRYQSDWTKRDWQSMADYMTPLYHQHASLLVAALRQAHRINEVRDPVIHEAVITNMHDDTNDTADFVTVGMTASADDRLIDDMADRQLYRDKGNFTEYWTFKREGQGGNWLLDAIEQATASGYASDYRIKRFAEQNGYFYSADMGWLLIPARGDLFGKGKFGFADINNHVIGMYQDEFLLQLYTYDPNPKNTGNYLIAQTNVPKSYGRIVVRRKQRFHWLAPRGLQRVSMESIDFNKVYEVFADDLEQVTSFELLHPAFMAQLEGLPFEVNIEVVDNVVYLYAPEKVNEANPDRYTKMLEVLREAYRQMKL